MCFSPGGLFAFLLLVGCCLLLAYQQRASLCSCGIRHADPRWRNFSCNWIECALADWSSRLMEALYQK